MPNAKDTLVIFEYKAFRKRLRECADSLPAWESVIRVCLNKYTREKNLDKIVESLAASHPYSDAIAAWNKISQKAAADSRIIDLKIQEFKEKNLLIPTRQPVFYLMDVLNTLIMYTSSGHYFSDLNTDDYAKIQGIREAFKNHVEELTKKVGKDPNASPDTDTKVEQSERLPDIYSTARDIDNLREMFREELAYIAQSNNTDDIFRDVKEIGNEIIPDIVKTLGPIVGNQRFHSDLDASMKTLEARIEDFISSAQSNIDAQIKAALDALEENFKDRLESEIWPRLQTVSPYVTLFVSTEQVLREVSENLKAWQNRFEAFIAEFFQLPDDIQKSCENFRLDFQCRDALKKDEHNAEIDPEEAEVLKHLFGVNGTDVFARLNQTHVDLHKSDNRKKIIHHAIKIEEDYTWETRPSDTFPDELNCIFKHAATRVTHIMSGLTKESINA